MTTIEQLKLARTAKTTLANASTEQKNNALISMADALIENSELILFANAEDVKAARGKVSGALLDRLQLTKERIVAMADGIRDVVKLPDPVGRVISTVKRPNGLIINRIAVPMGVMAIIYESRPNVTSDVAALSIKSGNVCVLRSGKDAHKSATAIVTALRKGLQRAGFIKECVTLVEDTSRDSAQVLMTANGLVDLLVPRGGKGLISACVKNATVPCIETGTGICHIYVDKDADLEKAVSILHNAKTSRPGVCNAAEVCLVHESIAQNFLPKMYDALVTSRQENPVELRLCEKSANIINGNSANADDFDTEFLDYVLAVKVVSSIDEAVEHITLHSTGHSEAIISEDINAQNFFTTSVDSAAVYVNASTRFTDGGEFGLGCELGISTQRLHARGPMGLEELCTYKYIIKGDGQIR